MHIRGGTARRSTSSLERERRKILVEVKSTVTGDTIPRAVREMLGREDVVAGVIVNDRIHTRRDHDGKPVLFFFICLYT